MSWERVGGGTVSRPSQATKHNGNNLCPLYAGPSFHWFFLRIISFLEYQSFKAHPNSRIKQKRFATSKCAWACVSTIVIMGKFLSPCQSHKYQHESLACSTYMLCPEDHSQLLNDNEEKGTSQKDKQPSATQPKMSKKSSLNLSFFHLATVPFPRLCIRSYVTYGLHSYLVSLLHDRNLFTYDLFIRDCFFPAKPR